METLHFTRRNFLKKSVIFGALAGLSGLGGLSGCKEGSEEQISPAEDLMREHGVLDRILMIYDFYRARLLNNEEVDRSILIGSARIIRTFIEDYHEKLEEDYLFPRFEKAGLMIDLVQTLRVQHKAGRVLTDRIIQIENGGAMINPDESRELSTLLLNFTRMYRPHAGREDTVFFPAIRKVVSKNEYFSLGEDFENKEHELFGEGGFESVVAKVASIEQELGIYDLAQFTTPV